MKSLVHILNFESFCCLYYILLGTISASLLGNLLTGKGTITAGEGAIRADQDFQWHLTLQQF